MTTTEQIVPISDLRIRQAAVLNKLADGPVYLMQRSNPAAVLLSNSVWDHLLETLENQDDLINSLKAELAIANGEYVPEDIDFDALEPEAGATEPKATEANLDAIPA